MIKALKKGARTREKLTYHRTTYIFNLVNRPEEMKLENQNKPQDIIFQGITWEPLQSKTGTSPNVT